MKVPDEVGVPEMLIVFDAQEALTPAGKPFAPAIPLLLIPVAPVVAMVIGVKVVLIQSVGLVLGAPALFGSETTIGAELLKT